MKRSISVFLVVLTLLTALCLPVFADNEPPELHRAWVEGDYVPGLSSFMVDGQVAVDGLKLITARFNDFARENQCTVHLWLWKSLASSIDNYAAFEDAVDAMSKNTFDDTVCILYVEDLNKTYIHVGNQVIPDCDTASIEALMLDQKAESPYYKMAAVFNALNSAAGHSSGRYAPHLLYSSGLDEEAIQEALVPLRDVFPHYIAVEYQAGARSESDEEGSVLRRDKNLNYDEIYAKWENKLDYYFADALFITYYGETGEAFLDVGSKTGLDFSEKEIKKLEQSFEAAASTDDYTGFAKGVAAIAQSVAGAEDSDTSILVIAAAAVLLLAVGGIICIKHRK